MGGQARNEFVVDTIGHCFICIEQIPPRLTLTSEPQTSDPSSIYSLRYLSRYLNLRLRNVFREEGLIPEYLLEKVDKSTLKANLCDSCASWNSKLSELYKQLEKIELETLEHLQLIRGKLLRADKDDKTASLNKLANHSSTSEVMGKLEIAEVLRTETMLKCSQKLRSIHPKVKVKNLTEKDVLRAKRPKLSEESSRPSSKRIDSPALSVSNSTEFPRSETDELPVLKSECDEVESEDYDGSNYVDDFGVQSKGAEDADRHNMKTMKAYVGAEQLSSNKMTKKKYAKDPTTGKVKCGVCSKEFVSVSSFQRHYKNVHLNIRFKCEICNKVFTDKDNLRGHQKAVHLKIKFKCDICDKAFASKRRLTVHQRSVHLKKELN